jgi:hypothetical protein
MSAAPPTNNVIHTILMTSVYDSSMAVTPTVGIWWDEGAAQEFDIQTERDLRADPEMYSVQWTPFYLRSQQYNVRRAQASDRYFNRPRFTVSSNTSYIANLPVEERQIQARRRNLPTGEPEWGVDGTASVRAQGASAWNLCLTNVSNTNYGKDLPYNTYNVPAVRSVAALPQ